MAFTQAERAKLIKEALGMSDEELDAERIERIVKRVDELEQGTVIAQYLKDTMPAAGRPGPGGRIYDGGPFSQINSNDGILSGVPQGGSDLARWLPTNKMKSRYVDVKHLEFVSPDGFDPSVDTYAQWLNGITIPECGFGPNATWSGFEYTQSGGDYSFQTDMMKPLEDGGLPYYEGMQLFQLNHNGTRTPIEDDRDWAVAILIRVVEEHTNWVLIQGRRDNSDMEFDGLLSQLTEGYIASKTIGRGIPHFVDPYVIDGAALIAAANVLAQLHINVRVQMNRIKLGGWTVNPGDMAVAMHPAMWDNLAPAIAAGAFDLFVNSFNFDGQVSQIEFNERLDGIRMKGSMRIDGFEVPILEDTRLAASSVVGSTPSITGDIPILVRAAGGVQLLSQDWLDWNTISYPTELGIQQRTLQDGFAAYGWVTEASACYFYWLKMHGRVTSKMHQFQGIINSVSVPVLSGDEVLSSSFTSKDFPAAKYHGGVLDPVDGIS